MSHAFTLSQARELLPAVRERVEGIVTVRADLTELSAALQSSDPSPHGGVAELKALQARLHEALGWFPAQGLQLKGIAPLLLDFPGRSGNQPILYCWIEGEQTLSWYHHPDLGFAGRRPIDELPL